MSYCPRSQKYLHTEIKNDICDFIQNELKQRINIFVLQDSPCCPNQPRQKAEPSASAPFQKKTLWPQQHNITEKHISVFCFFLLILPESFKLFHIFLPGLQAKIFFLKNNKVSFIEVTFVHFDKIITSHMAVILSHNSFEFMDN